MKSPMSLFTRLVATAALATAPFASFAVPTFSFTSASGALHPAGSQFSVDLVGSGLADLYAYQFSVTFDPAVLHVLAVTEGGFLPSGGPTFFDGGTIDNATGKLSFAFDTLISSISGVSGSGVLAHLDFAAVGAGTSTVGLTDVLALDSLLNEIGVTAQPIALVVPEPATVSLILLAGGALVLRRRRAPAIAARPAQH